MNTELMLETPPLPLAFDVDGVARVGNTRVTLETVIDAFSEGATAEEIAHQYPPLNLSDIYFVIAYYLRHRNAIEQYLKKQRSQSEAIRKQNEERYDPAGIRERLLARRNRGA